MDRYDLSSNNECGSSGCSAEIEKTDSDGDFLRTDDVKIMCASIRRALNGRDVDTIFRDVTNILECEDL